MKKINLSGVKDFLLKHKIVILSVILVVAIIIILLAITGGKRTDVVIESFAVSEDGNSMTLNISVSSSSGYVRKAKVKEVDGDYYITFYSTYGNSNFGAKTSFTIDLSSECDNMYVYGENKEYELVLKRNTSNNRWTLQYED